MRPDARARVFASNGGMAENGVTTIATANGTTDVAPRADAQIDDSLHAIELELARQAKQAKRFQGNVMFVGGMLVLLALAGLLAVATKTGTKNIKVTSVAAPAKKAAAPAAATTTAPPVAGALPSATSVSLKEFKVIPTATKVAAGKVV